MTRYFRFTGQLAVVLLIASGCGKAPKMQDYSTWSEYLGGPDRSHYSSLNEINIKNISRLEKVWEYSSGDSGQVQCNPIIVNGVLFGVTASNHLFALDAATGKEKWTLVQPGEGTANVNRGVTYWEDGNDKRILYAYGSFLYAVDATTGKVITSFGDQGKVSLKAGLEPNSKDKFVGSTSPGTLFEDLIIMPLRVGEGNGAALGYIQAFNVKTGKLAWVFKTLPEKGQMGASTWPLYTRANEEVGAINNWAGMAVDRERGIIYVPTGSAAFDFYGGNREGENLFANCLLALDAKTGKYIWHFQTVHHDIWDRDLPAPPNLLTVTHDGKRIDAVAQVTKSGFVFLFNRENGDPLFPIDEKAFPKSDLPGEVAWPTQPIPRLPRSFARQTVREDDISLFAENRNELLETYRKAKKGLYHPLGLIPTIVLPGADGGAEWGGAAVDPDGIMYVNANEMPWLFSLSKVDAVGGAEDASLTPGHLLYNSTCITCHGPELKGNPASGFPSLVAIKGRVDRGTIAKLITSGRGMMPGFSNISATEKQSIIDFLFKEEKVEAPSVVKAATPAAKKNVPAFAKQEAPLGPYKFNGYNKFLDNNGYPAITPPWGTLTAIDLNTGEHLWQKTLGEVKELTARGLPQTGTENYGGPVVTAGGLLFIAATKDGMFRAFDKKTGKLVWETELPAPGFATPSTYQVNGKQYIVIACGGTKLGTKKGDSYVAFAIK